MEGRLSLERVVEKYEREINRCQRLFERRRLEDTAGGVRYNKGKLVEEITKDLIRLAWAGISGDDSRLRMDRKKVRIKTNGGEYRVSQDIHVYVDDVFRLSVECKSYAELAMYKRVLVDAALLKMAVPSIRTFFLVQLENFLGGDYGRSIEPAGSGPVMTLNRLFPQLDLVVLTLIDGDRDIKRPIHDRRFHKPLNVERLEYAVERFREAMLMSDSRA